MALRRHTFCNVRLVRGEATASWMELRRRKSEVYSQLCPAPTEARLDPSACQHTGRALLPAAHLPCCSAEGCSQRRALAEQLWAPPEPQGFHSSSTACRPGGVWGLLVTRTATDVLTLPFSARDSPPPPNTNFLSIVTYV